MPVNSEVMVYCLDYDGCTDKPEARSAIIKHIVKCALENRNCKKIMITIGSLRQSVYVDFYNSHHYYEVEGKQYKSCSVLGREFIDELSTTLRTEYAKSEMPIPLPEVEFNPLVTGDIYNNLIPGTTFSFMDGAKYQKWRQTTGPVRLETKDEFNSRVSDMKHLDFAFWQVRRDPLKHLINMHTQEEIPASEEWRYISWRERRKPVELIATNKDGGRVSLFEWTTPSTFSPSSSVKVTECSKLLMLYMFFHDIALKLGDSQSFHFTFVDDKESIFRNLLSFFEENSSLIPFNCMFKCLELNSYQKLYPPYSQVTHTLKGTGVINPKYQQVMQVSARNLPKGYKINDVKHELVKTHRDVMHLQAAARVSSAPHSTHFRSLLQGPISEVSEDSASEVLVL